MVSGGTGRHPEDGGVEDPASAGSPSPLHFGEFTLDLDHKALYRGSDMVHLSPLPFDTLVYLVRNRGRLVGKDELLKAVWGGQRVPSTVEHAIGELRRTLGDDRDKPRFIATVPRRGYRFVAEVAELTDFGPEPKNAQPGEVLRRALLPAVAMALALLLMSAALLNRVPGQGPRILEVRRMTTSPTGKYAPFVTDRQNVYFTEEVGGLLRVGRVPLAGGEPVKLEFPFPKPALTHISPDGARLLVRSLVTFRHEEGYI